MIIGLPVKRLTLPASNSRVRLIVNWLPSSASSWASRMPGEEVMYPPIM